MRKLQLTLVGLLAAASIPAYAMTAGATNIGNEGCTPGYWKNHTDNWLEDVGVPIPTTTLFGDTFGVAHPVSFLEALQGGGGKGVEGAQKILARAATAAYLNAAHEDLGYPLRRGDTDGIIARVQAAWNSGDRDVMLALASELDTLNNLGCPLN